MTENKADAPGGGGGDEVVPERGFDHWLNRQLHRLYDPVLGEAVPDEILRLLEQFDERPDLPSEPSAPSSTDTEEPNRG